MSSFNAKLKSVHEGGLTPPMDSQDVERRLREQLEQSLGRTFSDEEWTNFVHNLADQGKLTKTTREPWIIWASRNAAWLVPAAVVLILGTNYLVQGYGTEVSRPLALAVGYLTQLAIENKFVVYGFSVSLTVSIAWAWILKSYMPRGSATDTAHIWVVEGTHSRVRDATEREVYEHYHGYGSWWEKVRGQWKFLRILGFGFAMASPHFIAYWVGFRAHVLGQGQDLWASVAVALGGALIFVATLRFLDVEFSPPSPAGQSISEEEIKQLTNAMTQFNAEWDGCSSSCLRQSLCSDYLHYSSARITSSPSQCKAIWKFCTSSRFTRFACAYSAW